MKIQIVGSGCAKCKAAESNVRNTCAELSLSADISHVYDVKEGAKLGVMLTPALPTLPLPVAGSEGLK